VIFVIGGASTSNNAAGAAAQAALHDDVVLDALIPAAFANLSDKTVSTDSAEKLADYGRQLVKMYPAALAVGASLYLNWLLKYFGITYAVVVIVVGSVLLNSYLAPTPTPQPTSVQPAPVVTSVVPDAESSSFAPDGTIIFVGDGSVEHINPTSAIAQSDEGTITSWSVYTADAVGNDGAVSAVALLAGDGASTGDVLNTLPPGKYTLVWLIDDGKGLIAKIKRNFTVT